MRILLLHEMSGVHTNLKAGLELLGHDVDIATYGDGWKRFPTTLYIGNEGHSFGDHLSRAIGNLKLITKLNQYDIIQVISPNPFYRPISRILTKYFGMARAKKIYVAAGSDPIYRAHVRKLKYYPPHDWFHDKKLYRRAVRFVREFDAIVPVCWEYFFCMREAGFKTEDVIPLPVPSLAQPLASNSKKVTIFHPLNRINCEFDFKGSILIQDALSRIQKKYGTYVQVIVAGGLPYEKYVKLSATADVVIDQAYSYSYGMSAAIALSQGKVVLSGCEGETKEFEFYRQCPVVNITPSVVEIENSLLALLEERDLSIRKKESFDFASNFHDRAVVAQRYADLYGSLLGFGV